MSITFAIPATQSTLALTIALLRERPAMTNAELAEVIGMTYESGRRYANKARASIGTDRRAGERRQPSRPAFTVAHYPVPVFLSL